MAKEVAAAGARAMDKDDPEGVIIEFVPQGRFVKVSAMHPPTLTEVSIVGDAARGEAALKRAAVQKLRYVLARKRRERRR